MAHPLAAAVERWAQAAEAERQPAVLHAFSIQELQAQGSRVILGLTASVIFREQFATEEEFFEVTSRDLNNEPRKHEEIVPNAYRGNMAHPKFRNMIVKNAQVLVDVGADGIFFDEANAGVKTDVEGFDDYHEADFRSYLCTQHPDWTPTSFLTIPEVSPDNVLDCGVPNCVGSGFSIGRYMDDSRVRRPQLFEEWGDMVANRIAFEPLGFLQTSEIAYWADIVRRVRKYARDTYQKELWITSNGLFPFVDFQSIGLYPYNAVVVLR